MYEGFESVRTETIRTDIVIYENIVKKVREVY